MEPVLFFFGEIPVYTYTVVVDVALIAGMGAVIAAGRRRGWAADTLIEAAVPVLAAAVVGARLAYVGAHWPAYQDFPLATLYIWEGGLDLGGALAAGTVMVLVVARIARVPTPAALDVAALGVLVAIPTGRLGCIPGACAYGMVLPAVWGWPLPDVNGEMLPRFPSQVVEAAAETLLAGGLWLLARRSAWLAGSAAAGALGGYGAIHLATAAWREDIAIIGPLTLGMLWAILALAAAVLMTGVTRQWIPSPPGILSILDMERVWFFRRKRQGEERGHVGQNG